MSEEANAAAGLVAELERLRTDNAELRASAELTQRQWQDLVAANAGQRRLLDLAQAEIAEARIILQAADTETLLDAARDLVREEETSNGACKLLHTRYWKEAQPEIDRLRAQFALAQTEIATLRDAHTAVLAWLERYGALLPQVIRDELRAALTP